jgi:spermidine/putrescine transport system substrate-binding protein
MTPFRSLLALCLSATALAALPAARPAQAADPGVLHIFNWTDYTSPDMLKKFTKETGIKVTLDTYDSNETLLAKLKAGTTGYDIVVPSSDFVKIFVSQGLLQKADVASMANFKNLEERWKTRAWDPQAEYTVPWQWGTTSFIYDTKVYPGPVDSLETLFKPPAVFKGQVGMFGSPSEVINLALIYLGKPVCNSNPPDLKAVNALLEAQKPFVKVYNSDGIEDRMASGETTMHEVWSGDGERARVQRPSLKYVYAKEGGIGWMDNLAIPVGAPDIDNAKKFMNFMMDPENAALESDFAGYQNAVVGSNKFLKPQLAAAPEFNPPADYKITFAPGCPPAATKDYDRIWTLLRK